MGIIFGVARHQSSIMCGGTFSELNSSPVRLSSVLMLALINSERLRSFRDQILIITYVFRLLILLKVPVLHPCYGYLMLSN